MNYIRYSHKHTNMPKPANNGPATDFPASSDGWAAKTIKIKASYCCK